MYSLAPVIRSHASLRDGQVIVSAKHMNMLQIITALEHEEMVHGNFIMLIRAIKWNAKLGEAHEVSRMCWEALALRPQVEYGETLVGNWRKFEASTA